MKGLFSNILKYSVLNLYLSALVWVPQQSNKMFSVSNNNNKKKVTSRYPDCYARRARAEWDMRRVWYERGAGCSTPRAAGGVNPRSAPAASIPVPSI